MTAETLAGGTFAMTEDITVTRMGFGAMQLAGPGVFGPPKNRAEAIAVLRTAAEAGITHIDTCGYYGPRVTNQIIREALFPYPEDLHIVTKVGARRDASGGWLELYYYWTESVHTHGGYAIDDPVNRELAPTQISLNQTAFANVIWDVTTSLRVACEVTYRDTDYVLLTDNNGVGFDTQFQWRF